MRVIGVIDLKDGRAVHARSGSRECYEPLRSVLLAEDRIGDAGALARAYRDRLAIEEIYVADLDRIVRGGALSHALAAIIGARVPLMVDAGTASPAAAREVLARGVQRVVVGLETLASLGDLTDIVQAVGGARTVFSLDMRGDRPVVRPESGLAGVHPESLARQAVACGAHALIALDLHRVGRGSGPDLSLIARLRAACPAVELIAGGGVRGREDLARLEASGCDAVLVGTALHVGELGGPRSVIGSDLNP